MEALKTTAHILNRVPSKSVPKTPFELWNGRKPSLNYLKVWGCPAEAKLFDPQQKKLDSKTISCHFIGYPDKSKGYKFYCPGRHTKFIETRHAVFLEDSGISGSFPKRDISLEELWVELPNPKIPDTTEVYQFVPPIIPQLSSTTQTAVVQQEHVDLTPAIQAPAAGAEAPATAIEPEITLQVTHQAEPVENQPIVRPRRVRKAAVDTSIYETYLSEDLYDVGKINDPANFKQAVECEHSTKWIEAMEEELKSMSSNKVWDLVEIPDGVKPIGCKWVYKVKRDSKGNVDKFKARLVAKGYTQVEGKD
jgi:hypothetical protein